MWERFALPLLEADAPGGGDLDPAGSLLELGGEAELSSVRRRDGRVEVRLWNRRQDRAIQANVAGRSVSVGPARIETFAVDARANIDPI